MLALKTYHKEQMKLQMQLLDKSESVYNYINKGDIFSWWMYTRVLLGIIVKIILQYLKCNSSAICISM